MSAFMLASLIVVASHCTEPPPADSPAKPLPREQSVKAYEQIKGLEGDWRGRSTKGWTERITYRTIAGGSCVMETSFDAHPNEMMVTMFHPDGDRLLLTHYCVAKNQPRLVATGWEDDGRKLTFSFLDGTNLPSRDKGHMDKVVFRFVDGDRFTSRWTWYQDGKESWMEEIEHERVKAADAAADAPKAAAKGAR